ncbi:MAG: gliding motility-associated C-terminal domain-containing protein [Bacteroidota bacterium]|nr:gliding motility-associated C-terminal domain-containing protein [Bacteroidota bacterium]
MNKPFYILFFGFFLLFQIENECACAQTNLIYNGDFELYDTCPVIVSQPGDPQLETCLGWKIPTYATSDYFNTCALSIVGVPSNTFGYQIPYSGNAYCGAFVQRGGPPVSTYGWWVEYIQSKLVSPLKAGFEYEFSVQVVLSDINEYAYWKFGAYFSQSPISRSDAKPFIGVIPQIMNVQNNFITDTLNWVEIKGKFIAQGNENYVTLGFFTDTLMPDTLRFTSFVVEPNNHVSYYYIDDCSVYETGNIFEYPNVFTPNGDGQNDEWKPFISEEEALDIYDRWGIKVFEITKANQTWDGRTTAGVECVDGVYYFIVKNKNENSSHTKKGFIQLVR